VLIPYAGSPAFKERPKVGNNPLELTSLGQNRVRKCVVTHLGSPTLDRLRLEIGVGHITCSTPQSFHAFAAPPRRRCSSRSAVAPPPAL
jgi:hypothetical protein